jgi:hypothetical protein
MVRIDAVAGIATGACQQIIERVLRPLAPADRRM